MDSPSSPLLSTQSTPSRRRLLLDSSGTQGDTWRVRSPMGRGASFENPEEGSGTVPVTGVAWTGCMHDDQGRLAATTAESLRRASGRRPKRRNGLLSLTGETATKSLGGQMTNLADIEAGILDVLVYEGVMPGGAPAELAITLLDIQNDALPTSKRIREHGAQAYGMLLFKSDSPRCPKQPVVWERFEDGLEVTAVDEERYLFDKRFHALCIQMVATFLNETAKDAKYAWLAPPELH